MTENDKDLTKLRRWTSEFELHARLDQSAMMAGHMLDLALSKAPDTPEQKLLKQAPYLIVGCLNARSIPLTTETLNKSVELFAEPANISYYLEFDARGEDPYTKIEAEAVEAESQAEPEIEPLAEESPSFQRQMAFLQKKLSISHKVEEAMMPTIRAELGLDPETSQYDTIQALSLKMRRGFGQLLEVAAPGATTNPDHEIWKNNIAVADFVAAYQKILKEKVISCAQEMGMSQVGKPAGLNPN